ncbi:unnamed protein product [Coffea canephora]|uniref:non-specific serine/threonine protein kinase n=1 Tax=Coffea canephora TaxID=49390 RepID=A0A068V1I6_COFCA|nr:unnamed protein product [Coffea canephora]
MAYLCIQLIFFFAFLFPISVFSQKNGIVTMGSTLTAGETSASPWLSPSGEFAFGFQKVQDKDLFLFSIWYDKIPDKMYANPSQVDHGFVNDTGNFILKGSDDSWLWESFRFPADKILPYQDLVTGDSLCSRQSATNFSQGRFYLRFRDYGNLVLVTRSVPRNVDDEATYYNSQTSDSTDAFNSGYQVTFDGGGAMYIRKRNNQTKQLNPVSIPLPPVSENYHRATIDFDGVFTHYYHPRTYTGNQNWTILWSKPDNICIRIAGEKGSGACGFNSVCHLEHGRAVCACPIGYILLDPDDSYGSCKPKSSLGYGEVEEGSAENLYDFEVVNDIDWPLSDFERINPSNETVCQQACLQDCFCAVAIFKDNSCWKKKLPLSNGRVDTLFSSIVPQGFQVESKPKDRGTLILVGSILLGTSFLVNLTFITISCLGVYLIYQKKKIIFPLKTEAGDINLHIFPYKELVEATNEFKDELGRGSFGIVYRGELQISSKSSIVAVKKLDRVAKDAEKEFRAEVTAIGQTNHKNLVRLLGFCDEGQHPLLVYEYMSHGTLARLLLHDPKPSWNLRIQIAIGIARGLVYLHEECRTQVIHCDIKPQNILLDEHFNARISDFGLAKLLMINQSRTMTSIRGTKGYVAPEWYRNTQITAKVDVYSFGVLLLTRDHFLPQIFDEFVENDSEALEDKMMLERFLMVALWCIQESSSLRPKMRKMSQMLEGIVEVMVPPCPYPFSTKS